MSKIGRRPIDISRVTATVQGTVVNIKGAKGAFVHELPACLLAVVEGSSLEVSLKVDTRKNRMLWGTHRAHLANKVKGASEGFTLDVNMVGLGYKAQLSGKTLVLTAGFSHKVEVALPEGVSAALDKTGQKISLSSIDRFLIGNAADSIRSTRPAEPYKGTGIVLEGEVVRRKEGKKKS